MKRILFTVFFIIVITGCSEVFQPDIKNVDSFLAIEGSITTQPGEHTIRLVYSRYSDRPYYIGVTDANVNVIDENGNRVHYHHSGNGVYTAYITANNAAKVGSTYYLEVETEDGAVFRSSPQLVIPSPEIKVLYCAYDHRTILTENTYGDILEQEYPVIALMIETDGILPSDNYYMYYYKAFEEHHTVLRTNMQARFPYNIYHIYQNRQLSIKYDNIIHTVNADEFGNFEVRNDELMYIIIDDMKDYEPFYPDTFDLVRTLFEGLLFKLSQYSLSPDAYTFYHDAEEQLEAEGNLFDPVYTQLIRNIECVSEPEQKVIGVFTASDITDYYAYMYINSRNQTYSVKINGFPEFWLDTCSWGIPDGWIWPPLY